MNQEILLHIILEKPPSDVDFALQKGKGSNYETIQKQRSNTQDLHFEFTVNVKGDKHNDALPDFLGVFVQGPSYERFIYIDIGASAGQKDSVWSRRLKIPLKGISWEIIDQMLTNANLILEACVPGTGKDGTPNCATVKPFDGWHLKQLTIDN